LAAETLAARVKPVATAASKTFLIILSLVSMRDVYA
jgi:hypothetical protein